MRRQFKRWLKNTGASLALCLLLIATHSLAADEPGSAGGSTAKTVLERVGSQDGVQQHLANPLVSGASPLTTFDGSASSGAQLLCPSSEKFIDLFVQPQASGDLSLVIVGQDIDLDGSVDYSYQVPFLVSGVCANGVISCDGGSWLNCRHYSWQVDSEMRIYLEEVSLTELGGCYCINNDCGNNLVWSNLAVVLKDLGGGVAGAVQAKDPKYAVTDVRIDGTSITYYGQDSAECSSITSSSGSSKPERYYDYPGAVSGDTEAEVLDQSQDPESYYNTLSTSLALEKTASELRQCSVRRAMALTELGLYDIIAPNGGTGAVRACGASCIEVVLGIEGDNYWCGSCAVYERYFNLFINHPDRIRTATLARAKWDDYMQVWIGGQRVWSGPNNNFPPETAGACELSTSWNRNPGLDLTNYFKAEGNIQTKIRVSVAGCGEGYAIVRLYVDDLCLLEESIENTCTRLETDSSCRLREETVDGVYTYRNFNPTGLTPLASCKTFSGEICMEESCEDWWEKKRTYLCDTGERYDFTDTKQRMERVVGDVSEEGDTVYYRDLRKEDGGWVSEEGEISLSSLPANEVCEKACKTRLPKEDTQAGQAGHRGEIAETTRSWDFYYKRCIDDTCPLDPGEEIVKDCQCTNDFAEATTVLEALNAAGKDIICSDGVRK
jgi:hypothetical protein